MTPSEIAKGLAWRTPTQLAARRAARQRRVARRHAFEVAGCAPPQAVIDAIAAELAAVRAIIEQESRGAARPDLEANKIA
jgi:hypothetical protein